VSLLLIRLADLEKLKQSAFGRYIGRYMTGLAQFWRLAGFGVMVIGAWYHLAWLIPLGLAAILLAWGWGLVVERIGSQM
jgi:hypothetical protein